MSVQPDMQQLDQRSATSTTVYPAAAYDFLLEGLNFAVEKVHGPVSSAQARLAEYMAREGVDLQEVWERLESGKLDPQLGKEIDEAGGFERLNRHVSGQELCWALRDYAVMRWGFLSPVVLGAWGIRCTMDFGNLVFDRIEHGRLQKEPHDRIEDFKDVFNFRDAFDRAFRVEFGG